MYMPNAKTQRQDPTPPIFHWLASGFGVGANAKFRFGVGSLASGNANFHILDTNMLVSPMQTLASGAFPNASPRRQVFCVLVEYRLKGQEFEKRLFNIYFLNQDISLNNKFRNMKF